MIHKFLKKKYSDLIKLHKNSSADESVIIGDILRSISDKKPELILRQIERDYSIIKYYNIYIKFKKYKLNDLSFLIHTSFDKKTAIELIIILFFIKSSKKKISIKFYKPDFEKEKRAKIIPAQSDLEWMIESIKARPILRKNVTIPKYAETTIIAAGKLAGMKIDLSRSPYISEPLHLMSPQSDVQQIILMFSAQSLKTFISELVCNYYMRIRPSEILYVSGNASAVRKYMERRIEPRARYDGVIFRATTDSANSRRSGDLVFSKEFDGGNFDLASALSPQQIAQETKKIILADELDKWRVELSDHGSTWDQIVARAQAWGEQKKILAFSTPTLEPSSMIYGLYQTGDQRIYYVPCPFCGFEQKLELQTDKSHGLKWEMKDGRILKKSIEYICKSKTCNKGIREFYKIKMLQEGAWRKQARGINDYVASFHLNAIYSPMKSWFEIAQEYEISQENEGRKQTFHNLVMGWPYKATGTRPKSIALIENRGTYKSGEVPDGVLYLTAGVDVQRGSQRDETNPPRLEMEILGVGYAYRTWSIEYINFEGAVDDPFSGAWKKMEDWLLREDAYLNGMWLPYSRRVDGFRFPVSLIFVDSGDGELTDVVYRFCERWGDFIYPIKGANIIQRRKNEKPDEITETNFKRYRAVRMQNGETRFDISTNYYKNMIYNNLKVPRQAGMDQRPCFCNFPADYGKKYFDQLTAEEKLSNGAFDPGRRRNEALDCRVYAQCAADVFLDSEKDRFQEFARQRGESKEMLLNYDRKYVINLMIEGTRIRKPA